MTWTRKRSVKDKQRQHNAAHHTTERLNRISSEAPYGSFDQRCLERKDNSYGYIQRLVAIKFFEKITNLSLQNAPFHTEITIMSLEAKIGSSRGGSTENDWSYWIKVFSKEKEHRAWFSGLWSRCWRIRANYSTTTTWTPINPLYRLSQRLFR